MFHSEYPLDDEVFLERHLELHGFYEISGRNFTHQSDSSVGNWHNYFIGVIGDLASDENEVLWPNRVRPYLLCSTIISPI